jgi:hypothetical protein
VPAAAALAVLFGEVLCVTLLLLLGWPIVAM